MPLPVILTTNDLQGKASQNLIRIQKHESIHNATYTVSGLNQGS